MRWLVLTLALISSCALGQEVAKLFSRSVSAADLRWTPGEPPAQAARQLRELALKEAGTRFVAANNLKATPDEVAAYGRWEAEFQRQDKARRATRQAELERVAMPDEKQR